MPVSICPAHLEKAGFPGTRAFEGRDKRKKGKLMRMMWKIGLARKANRLDIAEKKGSGKI